MDLPLCIIGSNICEVFWIKYKKKIPLKYRTSLPSLDNNLFFHVINQKFTYRYYECNVNTYSYTLANKLNDT